MSDKVFLITGTSSGIGKSLAEKILSHSNVVGVSRRKNIDHKNYQHFSIDLNTISGQDIQEVINHLKDFKEIHIIHNAGIIEPIAPVSKIDLISFKENHQVNFLAPVEITNSLLSKLQNQIKTISFIGSGAARHTIDAWSAYCSSKAALLMFAKCLQQESIDRGQPLKVFDISPGVIDTPMQEKIRSSNGDLFLQKSRFDNLYENNDLTNPNEVAQKIDYLLKHYSNYDTVEVNLRDFPTPDNQ